MVHKSLRILTYAILCSLDLESLDKLLLNRKATEEDTCMSGFPYMSKVSVAQREKRDFSSYLAMASRKDKENPFSTFSQFNVLELLKTDASSTS